MIIQQNLVLDFWTAIREDETSYDAAILPAVIVMEDDPGDMNVKTF